MSFLKRLAPQSWLEGGEAQTSADGASAAAPAPQPATSPLAPSLQMVTTGLDSSADPELTQKIIKTMTETVPAISDLLAKAELLKEMEGDLGKRLMMVMKLNGFTPMQVSDALSALARSLAQLRERGMSDIGVAREAKVTTPTKRIEDLGQERAALLEQAARLEKEVTQISSEVAAAQARITQEERKLDASLAQAQSWLDNLTRLIASKR